MMPDDRQDDAGWFVSHGRPHESPIRMRLFCFHYAGAAASIFRNWQNTLPHSVEVVAIELPGRGYRLDEPLLRRTHHVVEQLQEVIIPRIDTPYVIFGHSMGVLVAFDLVRALRKRSCSEPRLFIASGRDAPEFLWQDAGLEQLPDDEFIEAVRDYNGTPDALLQDPELRDLWLPRLRADLGISATHQHLPGTPLSCPILVLAGDKDPLISAAGQQAWASHTHAEIRYCEFSGDHFFLHSAEAQVLATIRAELEKQLLSESIR